MDVRPQEAAGHASKEGATFAAEVWDWFKSIAAAVVIVLLLNSFAVTQAKVIGHSMEPTLSTGERLIVNRLIYQWSRVRHDDVVVLRDPDSKGQGTEYLVKRIVAVAEDRVEIRSGVLYVNGIWKEDAFGLIEGGDFGPYEIAPGFVFVMGDNRHAGESRDSRMFGAVPLKSVVGRAEWIVWPLKKWGGL